MKLFMTLLVRDLDDIVGANLRYHLGRGVDHVIVTDNGSVDRTRAMLEDFVRTGRVTVIDEPQDDYDQPAWVTRMARAAAEMGADWVINNDADEMWWPLDGDLKSTLERVAPETGSVIVPRMNMLPLRRLRGHPFERMVVGDTASVNGLGERLPGKAAHRAVLDVEVRPGNHRVASPSLGPPAATKELMIFHYPHRSYKQLERKIALGGAAVARNTTAPPSAFDVWRELYERRRAGTLRAWYDALPHGDDPAVEEWIASGDAVRDERLAVYLRRHVFSASAPRT
jgi:hypothetical protein